MVTGMTALIIHHGTALVLGAWLLLYLLVFVWPSTVAVALAALLVLVATSIRLGHR